MSIRNLLSKVWRSIRNVFNSVNDEVKVIVPIAIKAIEGLKAVMDSPVDDIVLSIAENAIAGQADDILIEKAKNVIKEWLPKILLDLKLIQSVGEISEPEAQLKAILAQLKLSSNEAQDIVFHGICSLLIEKLSDGKFSWSDSIAVGEYYYQYIYKQQ